MPARRRTRRIFSILTSLRAASESESISTRRSSIGSGTTIPRSSTPAVVYHPWPIMTTRPRLEAEAAFANE